MRVYAAPFDVEYKGKNDPVTRADKESNALLCERLLRAFPDIPVVAEESDPAATAASATADAAWFVDPLDGTREFVERNGEFAVMIGLAEKGRATSGSSWHLPGAGRSSASTARGLGGRRRTARATVHVSRAGSLAGRGSSSRAPARPIASPVSSSRSGQSSLPYGSSGQGVLVATGQADVYLQPGRAGKRWDACAPEAIVRAAGGDVTDAHGNRSTTRRARSWRTRRAVIADQRPRCSRVVVEKLRGPGERRDQADVVVIGAGIMGSSIAYHLARAA